MAKPEVAEPEVTGTSHPLAFPQREARSAAKAGQWCVLQACQPLSPILSNFLFN